MVIQSNMPSAAIREVWPVTEVIFEKHHIPIANKPLKELAEGSQLVILLQELNAAVGSSSATCTEGG